MDYANYNSDNSFQVSPNILMEPDYTLQYQNYPFQEEVYNLIGACMEVHKNLGQGFLKSVYHEALCIELTLRNIPFESDKLLHVYYKEFQLKKTFKAGIYAYDQIVVELKSVDVNIDDHRPQVINYLSATKHGLAVLVNFGTPSLQYRRVIFSKYLKF